MSTLFFTFAKFALGQRGRICHGLLVIIFLLNAVCKYGLAMLRSQGLFSNDQSASGCPFVQFSSPLLDQTTCSLHIFSHTHTRPSCYVVLSLVCGKSPGYIWYFWTSKYFTFVFRPSSYPSTHLLRPFVKPAIRQSHSASCSSTLNKHTDSRTT